jgi:alpha-aminoadipate carrier protein LysW
MVKCPECDAEIKVPEDSIEGEIVTCPDCGAGYELVKSKDGSKKGPDAFEIKPAQVVGEDWGQ